MLSSDLKPCSLKRIPYLLVALALLGGLISSIISWMDVCTESCAATHDYRFFGLSFEPFGLLFFTLALILHLLSLRYHVLSYWLGYLVAGGLGTEAMLIVVQKLQIGHWCPLCLTIAGFLATAALILLIAHIQDFNYYIRLGNRRMIISFFLRGSFMFTAAIAGFLLAFWGVAKIEDPQLIISEKLKREDPIFGKRDSKVEVYVFTDWFCPACRSIDPILNDLYPKIAAQAGLMFVDFPVHPDSINYTPYNLSFMLKEKQKYFQIRQALQALALTKKAPTIHDVQKAVAPFNVVYRQLNYVDVDSGLRFFEELAKTFDVKSTPSMVIVNRQTHAFKLLHGTLQINEEEVMQKIKEMSSSK